MVLARHPHFFFFCLQSIVEELVHLGDARGHAKVNGAVSDLDDESTDDVGVDLGGDLELLALADVGGFGDGGFETREGPVVEGLEKGTVSISVSHLMCSAAGLWTFLWKILQESPWKRVKHIQGEQITEKKEKKKKTAWKK